MHIFINQVAPWSRVLLEQLTGLVTFLILFKKFEVILTVHRR